MGENFAARIRKEMFETIITEDIAFFDQHKTGEIMNRYNNSLLFYIWKYYFIFVLFVIIGQAIKLMSSVTFHFR